MDFLKGIGGKIAAGVVALTVIAGAISWWQMSPASRDALLSSTGHLLGWMGIVLALPWATFFLIGRIAKLDSNAAGAALVAGYTAVEGLLLAWLFAWNIHGATHWTFFIAAVLIAAVYNLFTCDWIAEKC